MRDTPVSRLSRCGQSVWLDGVSRSVLLSGELVALVQEDGVGGVGCSAAVLEHCIAAGSDYDADIAALARSGLAAEPIYDTLLLDDVRTAADLLRPVYEQSAGVDGLVTLELSPYLAHDAAALVLEGRRLWDLAGRANLFIKIPGTLEGVAALRRLVSEGISVRVDPVFSVPRYRSVAEAYLDGLSRRAARGLPLERVASVVGLPLGRVDRLLEPQLARLAQESEAGRVLAGAIRGEAAIALAKVLRGVNREIHRDSRYLALAARGATPQRLAWVIANEREAGCFDLRYPEALVGPETVQVMSPGVLAAYRERGRPVSRLDLGMQDALALLEQLRALGIDPERLAQELEDEGVQRLARPYDSLMRNIELKRRAALGRGGGEL
ncbi:transaldolase family protein [Geomonas azotofigens]|uniref:transaldolase family protein n=1 Tax=Geomonas azotofigens TaxID=2843196 RepID=UPI001C10B70C|nr:transaldolase family protein [Geomonas azotofigens]MBU5614763.1 transaldolase [Geomonas azotofigens]